MPEFVELFVNDEDWLEKLRP